MVVTAIMAKLESSEGCKCILKGELIELRKRVDAGEICSIMHLFPTFCKTVDRIMPPVEPIARDINMKLKGFFVKCAAKEDGLRAFLIMKEQVAALEEENSSLRSGILDVESRDTLVVGERDVILPRSAQEARLADCKSVMAAEVANLATSRGEPRGAGSNEVNPFPAESEQGGGDTEHARMNNSGTTREVTEMEAGQLVPPTPAQFIAFPGSFAREFGNRFGWWRHLKGPATMVASGVGNAGSAEVGLLNGLPRTVIFCKTVTGEVCGGYMLPIWGTRGGMFDPFQKSFVFALVNEKLEVPVRFMFVGYPVNRVGCIDWTLCFGPASGRAALELGSPGVRACWGRKWKPGVRGGISTLVGKSGQVWEWAKVAAWEFWKS
jgi:hypothetical protein